jgi:NAD(P)-dependent dehydrogenase (short-subunit alcohol dehydrogenase family)
VNAVCPGWVKTEMDESVLKHQKPRLRFRATLVEDSDSVAVDLDA